MQDQGARNGAQENARQSARLDKALKGASQRCESKVQDIGFYKLARQKFKTLDSTKMQHKGALHMRHMQKEGTSHTEGI